jgi:4-aminobutyrate aminotransferase
MAAIVVEPIQGEGGYIVPAPGFLCGLRQICDRYGILLIYDEVQSGVGRTGKMWAHQHESAAIGDGACAHCKMANAHGCTPDILVTAKGLGAGMPIGGIIARRALMDRRLPGAHGSTYAGNAVACAAANAVLDLVSGGIMQNAADVGAHLKNGLHQLQARYDIIGDVRGRGRDARRRLCAQQRNP